MSYLLPIFGRNMAVLIHGSDTPCSQKVLLGQVEPEVQPREHGRGAESAGFSWGIPHCPVTQDKSQCFTIRYIK